MPRGGAHGAAHGAARGGAGGMGESKRGGTGGQMGGSIGNRGGIQNKMLGGGSAGGNMSRGGRGGGMRGGRGGGEMSQKNKQAHATYKDAHDKYTQAYHQGDQKGMMQHSITMANTAGSLAQMNPQAAQPWSQIQSLMQGGIQAMGGEQAISLIPGAESGALSGGLSGGLSGLRSGGISGAASGAMGMGGADQNGYRNSMMQGGDMYGQEQDESYGAEDDQYGADRSGMGADPSADPYSAGADATGASQFAPPPTGDDSVAASSNGAGGRFGDPVPGQPTVKPRIGLAGASLNKSGTKLGAPPSKGKFQAAPPPTGDDSVAASSNGAGGRFGDSVD